MTVGRRAMRRSRPSRSGRNFSAAAALLLHLGAFVVIMQRALSTPAGAGGAAGATGYQRRWAYGFYDVGEDCTPSSLWFKEVDAESYELGCREIEVGSKRRLQFFVRFFGSDKFCAVSLAGTSEAKGCVHWLASHLFCIGSRPSPRSRVGVTRVSPENVRGTFFLAACPPDRQRALWPCRQGGVYLE